MYKFDKKKYPSYFHKNIYQDKFTNTLNEIGHVIGDDKKLGCLYFFLLLLSPITVNVSQVKQVLHDFLCIFLQVISSEATLETLIFVCLSVCMSVCQV